MIFKKLLKLLKYTKCTFLNSCSEQQMVQIQSLQHSMVPHQSQTLYIQQPQTPGRIQTIAQQAPPPLPPAAYKTAVKRPRSPSPPPQVPVSMYHQGYTAYKPPSVAAGSYQGSPQSKFIFLEVTKRVCYLCECIL